MKNRILACCALLALAAGCESDDLIRNPLVDRWCGERPCNWQVEGEIERVGTWHPNDYAVALRSDDATLEQVNENASSSSVTCIGFSLLAKVEEGAKVYLELDFLNDGVVEWSERLPAGDFQPLELYVTPPTWFEGVRFVVRKDGPGAVTLARLRAVDIDTGECRSDPVPLTDRPSGAYCDDDEECTIGACDDHACAECATDDDCPEGSTCGERLEYVTLFETRVGSIVRGCSYDGGEQLGSPCDGDAECASGVCCDGACSECCGERAACEGEQTCELGERPEGTPEALELRMPMRCDPQQQRARQGDYCLLDADCASGHCLGLASYACLDEDCADASCLCQHAVAIGGSCE